MTARYRPLLLLPVVCGLLALVSPAQASFFDVLLETWSAAPPYPTGTPVRAHVLDDIGGGVAPLHTLSQGLMGAGAVGGSQYSTLGTGSDGNPAPGGTGPSSFFDVFLESVTPAPEPPQVRADSFFDLFTEISIVGTGLRGTLGVVCHACLDEEVSPYVHVDYSGPGSFFDVDFLVGIPEEPEMALVYRAHYELSDAAIAAGGQFVSKPVPHLLDGLNSFFDVYCEVGMTGSLPAGTKVLTVTTGATMSSAPIPASRTSWGALKGLYR